jgi:hypothetical protein
MRVGILTFHNSYNFGANLQALAMQSALRKLGVNPVVVDYRDPKKLEAYRELTPAPQADAHEEFLSNRLELSPRLSTESEVRQYCCDSLDLLIVGSDAVFRMLPKYELRRLYRRIIGRKSITMGHTTELPVYFADWPEAERRNLYVAGVAASSEGTRYRALKRSLGPDLDRSLRRFQFLSVRDDWTASMVTHFTRGEVQPRICPDPVMVLRDAFEIPKSEEPEIDLSRVLLVSGRMDEAWLERLAKAAHSAGLKLGSLPNPDTEFSFKSADISLKLPISPLRWYRMLGTAAGFLGIRFHALVSSLAGKRPAFALDRQARLSWNYAPRSKVFDLCKRAGVPSRYSSVEAVVAKPPEQVLEALFDSRLQARADEYSDKAIDQFYATLREVLAGADRATNKNAVTASSAAV